MRNTGLSGRESARHTGFCQTVINRLLNQYTHIDDIRDRKRSGRLRIRTRRTDEALNKVVRRYRSLAVPFQYTSVHQMAECQPDSNTLQAPVYNVRRQRPALSHAQKTACLFILVSSMTGIWYLEKNPLV